jgi:short-subunit dehydrogenase
MSAIRSLTMQRSRMLLQLAALMIAVSTLSGCATTPESNADRVVVIAGASSGFGRGVALELADQRAQLVLAARRTELLDELVRECEARGARAIAVTTDVSRESDVKQLADAAIDRFGRIDVWINMAGVGAFGRFNEVPLADHHRVIDVNVNGVINGSYYAIDQFRKQSSGTLINIASVAGRVPLPYYPSYVASKHAVIGLGASINQELRASGDRNIHVSTINPFSSDTPWFDHAANYSGRKARMILLDPPEKTIRAVVAATLNPRQEVNVGYKSKLSDVSHRFARRLTEGSTAAVVHKVAIQDAPPMEQRTAGSLYEPMQGGQEVDGDVRRRLAEGDLKKIER